MPSVSQEIPTIAAMSEKVATFPIHRTSSRIRRPNRTYPPTQSTMRSRRRMRIPAHAGNAPRAAMLPRPAATGRSRPERQTDRHAGQIEFRTQSVLEVAAISRTRLAAAEQDERRWTGAYLGCVVDGAGRALGWTFGLRLP